MYSGNNTAQYTAPGDTGIIGIKPHGYDLTSAQESALAVGGVLYISASATMFASVPRDDCDKHVSGAYVKWRIYSPPRLEIMYDLAPM